MSYSWRSVRSRDSSRRRNGAARPAVQWILRCGVSHTKTCDGQKPDVFHSAVEEVVRFLESKNVDLVSDPLRPRIETEDPISIESLAKIAKDAGASYLLYIIIDRPISQWLKVTVQCYDFDGKMLWQESAGYTGAFDVNSKKALPEIMKKLGKQFAVRFDRPGLMLKKDPPPSPSDAGGNPQQ